MKGFSLIEILIALSLAGSMVLLAEYALSHSAELNAKITQNYQEIFS